MITVRLYSMWNTVYQLRAFLFGQFHSWHEAHQLVLLRLWVSGNLPLGGRGRCVNVKLCAAKVEMTRESDFLKKHIPSLELELHYSLKDYKILLITVKILPMKKTDI